VCAGVLVVAGIFLLPSGDQAAARPERNQAAGPEGSRAAASFRDDALHRARIRLTTNADRGALLVPPPDASGLLTRETVECRFVPRMPGGTSFKFDCALPTGEIIRVKYGHEPEIHAEIAATRLLTALGYAADHMYLVPRVRCQGCPGNPFVTMAVLDRLGLGVPEHGSRDGFTDFEWVAVERKFEAPAIEDDDREGWAWWELKNAGAPRDEIDALRLLAVFLAHWDNKAENQRLVCLDSENGVGGHFSETVSAKNDPRPHFPCRDPLLMIQDVGATFGPAKVNLSQWRQQPMWLNRGTCTVSMRAMPFGGSTFDDVRISDGARVQVGRALAGFSDEEVRRWFAAARFPEFYSTTGDSKDLDAWVRAYRYRVSQILDAGPCRQDG
jgi:hypothetical protein